MLLEDDRATAGHTGVPAWEHNMRDCGCTYCCGHYCMQNCTHDQTCERTLGASTLGASTLGASTLKHAGALVKPLDYTGTGNVCRSRRRTPARRPLMRRHRSTDTPGT
jgi:hypothetical protein